MFFVSDSGRNIMNQTVRLDKNVLFQKSMFVYIKVSLSDKGCLIWSAFGSFS